MGTIEYLPEGMVSVINCDDMRKNKKPIPTWLIGTPTLVSYGGTDIYRGTQAVAHLQDFAITYTEHATTQRLTTQTRKPPAIQPSAASSAASARRGDVIPHPPMTNPSSNVETDNDRELSDLWESKIQDDDAEERLGSGKITGDDLARAVSQRQQTMHNVSQSGPPPPPPPQEKD
tara:strand:+ start:1185 stop:1709 length:525 start_codon:yes stop_codon:yes gene_type:complete